jgi:2-keto-3-deoxy-6-phosphogluconate aldolase
MQGRAKQKAYKAFFKEVTMIKMMKTMGISSNMAYYASMASIFLSIGSWFMRKDEDQGNAERFGIFVGLWAPTLAILGRALEEEEVRKDERVVS